MPGAVGVALGDRARGVHRTVIATIGDGSFQYSVQAVWTAAQHKLPIVFVVFRNGEYSILKSFAQLEEAPGVPGLDLPGLDIVSVAKGFGLRSVQANTAEEIRDQFKLAVAAESPTVIVVDTQPQDATRRLTSPGVLVARRLIPSRFGPGSPDPGRASSTSIHRASRQGRHMPVYTCTTTTEAIDRGTKRDLAAEYTRIDAEIDQVPTTYASNVVFHEVLAENLYSDSLGDVDDLDQRVRYAEVIRLRKRPVLLSKSLRQVPASRNCRQGTFCCHPKQSGQRRYRGWPRLPEPGQEAAWIAE